ncbi:hypothetical protein HU200_029341 [Digitaria exilis]|uniref:Small auxin up regulated protein n=1 Tax=Digitaria exilis TaxID=1010633 RepID=A0A835BR44_9POAL|nr:hypothetical protein HU200_029341 [Digitaria exilis]
MYKEGRVATAVRSLLDRRRFGGGRRSGAAVGCFSVYVGAGRERFAVPVERANHPLFRRLLDDAERDYRYAAQGPLALPGCDVAAFLAVMWKMEHDNDEEDGEERIYTLSSSPMCALIPRRRCGVNNGGRVEGEYRMLSPTPRSSRRWRI